MQLAGERMYARKRGRTSSIGDQTRDLLMQILGSKLPELHDHCSEVAQLCRRVGSALQLRSEALEELVRAAELHDIGRGAMPDAILATVDPPIDAEQRLPRPPPILRQPI